jgi:hypothetical protein
MAFGHVVDRRKRRGFPGSTVAASCGGRLVPQSASRPSVLRIAAVLLAVVAGRGRAADDAPVEPDAPQVLGRLLEGMRRALPPGPGAAALGEALEQAAELALENRAEAALRRRAVDEQARRLEQLYGPLLQIELETVRMSCPGLTPKDRRALVEAGRKAVRELAEQHAAATVRGTAPPGQTAVRQAVHARVAQAVEPLAPAAEFATFVREAAARQARREEAARIQIVAKLDEQFELSARQREAILADLRGRWDPAWIRELDDRDGIMINDQRPAPDFADACIAPHLDADQRAAWQAWCQAAGRRRLGMHIHNWSGVPNAPKLDPWWSP